jgi:hypothetical protein
MDLLHLRIRTEETEFVILGNVYPKVMLFTLRKALILSNHRRYGTELNGCRISSRI